MPIPARGYAAANAGASSPASGMGSALITIQSGYADFATTSREPLHALRSRLPGMPP